VRNLINLVSLASSAAFTAVAVLALLRWRRLGGAPARWASLSFGVLAFVTLVSVLPEPPQGAAGDLLGRVTVAALVLFPFFLYRFTTSFSRVARRTDRVAQGLTLILLGTAVVLPISDESGDETWLLAFLGLLLIQWSFLSFVAALQLWRAGEGQPTLARRRMRTMALASGLLNTALLLVGATSSRDSATVDLAVQGLALLSGVGFLVGFSPPLWLRVLWRRPERQALDNATGELMSASSVVEITDALLPRVASIVGARTVELTDDHGAAVATYEQEASNGSPSASSESEQIALRPPFGALIAWTSPYTPYFGRDEMGVLRSLGALADLALARASSFVREQENRAELERANVELTAANVELHSEVENRKRVEEALTSAREEAERANRAKSEFLSRMSHELRTPLNAILGFGQLLDMEDLDPEQRDAVAHILKAGRHLLDLVNEVLDISRIEADRLSLSIEPVPVAVVVSEVLELIKPLADGRGVSLATFVESETAHVNADAQRLKQVLLNLLSNAVKYNRPQGSVSVRLDSPAAERVRVAVTDTGPGITEDQLEHLFTPFHRLGVQDTQVEGTGLGLALSKRLVDALGGTLGVDSTPGVGSCFWVELAAASAPEAQFSESTGRLAAQSHDHETRRTILYIEDNLANIRLVERILAGHPDLELLTSMQATLGLDLAREHRPDLVLLDLHLPDMEGEEALRRLRAAPETSAAEIVVVSADATDERVKRLLAVGANDYLTKPLDVHKFKDLLERPQSAGARR
jgi:signal transduction histidine kinase/ActR/RegA family two-component response regulator